MPPYLARSMRERLLLKSGLMASSRSRGGARRCARYFPACLDGAPMVARSADSPLSIALDAWLAERGLMPSVVAGCDDSALARCSRSEASASSACSNKARSSPRPPEARAATRRRCRAGELLYLIRPAGRHAHPLVEEIERRRRCRAVAPESPSRASQAQAGWPRCRTHGRRQGFAMERFRSMKASRSRTSQYGDQAAAHEAQDDDQRAADSPNHPDRHRQPACQGGRLVENGLCGRTHGRQH